MAEKMLVGYIQEGVHSGIDKYLLAFAEAAFECGASLDFLTDSVSAPLEKKLSGWGFGLIEVPSLKNPVKQYRAIKKILREGGYDAAYFNISEAFNCLGLLAAKSAGIPYRIAHCHSAGVDRQNKYVRAARHALHIMFRPIVSRVATRRLACSSVAAKWMFDKDSEMVYNSVSSDKFRYNPLERQRMREELGISENARVYIHIGHFCYAKNNFFLMDIMKSVLERDKSALLLCVGCGVDFDAVKDYAQKLGISDSVRFLGVREDVAALLSAADAFVFPSRFEGLGIVCVEAQFSGLCCFVSDVVPQEAKITDDVVFLPLGDPDLWAAAMTENTSPRAACRPLPEAVRNYDINNQKQKLTDILKGNK